MADRRDEYLDSMLKDLGSAYFRAMEGDEKASELDRLVRSVREHQASRARRGASRPSPPALDGPAGERPGEEHEPPHRGRWRVTDVMATNVITVDRDTPYKEVARLLADNDVTALPVLSGGERVLGMVSEADVLRREERSFSRMAVGLPRRTRHEREQAGARTAGELMTAPAVTIHPDAPLGAAARLMNGHHIRRLPVVNPAGELLGVVSRQDLLRVFLRSDADIAAEIADTVREMMPDAASQVTVAVEAGIVTLTGTVSSAEVVGAMAKKAAEVEGVVSVSSELTVGGGG